MLYVAIAVLYLIAGVLGTWSASLFWRAWHAWRLERRARRKEQAPVAVLSAGRRRFGIGVALVALPLAGIAFSYAGVVRDDADAHVSWPMLAARALTGVLLFVAAGAVYVAFRFDPSRGRRRCGRCWYDMSATAGRLCPECGHEPESEKGLYRTRRAPRLLVLACLFLASAYGAWTAPRIYERGWAAAVPTTLLIAGLPWWPDSMIEGSEASLTARIDEEDVWEWQESLLRWRARGVLRRSGSAHALDRAVKFASDNVVGAWSGEPDPTVRLGPRGMLAVIRESCAPGQSAPNANGAFAALYTSSIRAYVPESLDGSIAPAAFELVRDALASPSEGTRVNAASWAAYFVTPEHVEALVPLMRACIEDESNEDLSRSMVVWNLAPLAGRSDAAWQALRACAMSEHDPLRVAAFASFRSVKNHDDEVLELASGALGDANVSVGTIAMSAMLRDVAEHPEVLDKAAAAVRERPWLGTRVIARLAMERPDDPRVATMVDVMLQSKDPTVLDAACQAAGAMGARGARWLERLRSLGKDDPTTGAWYASSAQSALITIEHALRAEQHGPGAENTQDK